MRLPTYKELRKFVEVEGWENKDKLSHKRGGDHRRYLFTTPTGERLFTRISHGSGEYKDPDVFQHILREQLYIDEVAFWEAVDRGKIPVRPVLPTSIELGASIDAKLAGNLIMKVKLTPSQLIGMTQEQAVERWREWLSKPQQ